MCVRPVTRATAVAMIIDSHAGCLRSLQAHAHHRARECQCRPFHVDRPPTDTPSETHLADSGHLIDAQGRRATRRPRRATHKLRWTPSSRRTRPAWRISTTRTRPVRQHPRDQQPLALPRLRGCGRFVVLHVRQRQRRPTPIQVDNATLGAPKAIKDVVIDVTEYASARERLRHPLS